jgi:hypothetical protein
MLFVVKHRVRKVKYYILDNQYTTQELMINLRMEATQATDISPVCIVHLCLRCQYLFSRCVIARRISIIDSAATTMKNAIPMSNALRRNPIAYSVNRIPRYCVKSRAYHASQSRPKPSLEPRLEDHGRVIIDEYSIVRDHYCMFSSIKALWIITYQ